MQTGGKRTDGGRGGRAIRRPNTSLSGCTFRITPLVLYNYPPLAQYGIAPTTFISDPRFPKLQI